MEASYQGSVSYENNENFQRISQTIASNIKKMSQNVSSMSKMISQLQTPQDSQELRNQLRQIQNYTQKMAKDTSTMIMEMMKTPADSPADKLTRDRLRDEYMATLNAFQATQKVAAQKTKEDVRKAKAQNFKIGDPFDLGDRAESGESARPRPLQQQLTAQSETELQELEERERDIRQLENDIMDVNSIFKKLGTMIHEQGSVVNSIESSVEYASQNVESATRELNTAATYKNKLRKKKIYLAIFLIIVVAIILIIAIPRG
ncbi:syntaxin-7 [Pararge aegeria]|uniref:syntaxin-7 n=1 Tax=Pararge aegeria TaxID=116150 RepID=UPI0019D20F68|nr:syntaxin-7 [Pararge aegeria]XP_039763487.1 syntaxin-7 [Pararge aegeria]